MTKYMFNLYKSIAREQILLAILSILCLIMVLGLGEHERSVAYWHMSAQYTMKLELSFIIAYFLVLKTHPPLLAIINQYKKTTLLIFLWFISVLISFLYSPYNLIEHSIAIERLEQSFVHLLFFIFVWDFFKRWTVNYKILFYTIAFSSLLVAGKFIYDWNYSPWICDDWLSRPPLNSNIRHTGYQIEAAIGFFIAFIIKKNINTSVNFLIITLLMSFLFWTGGRGGLIAVYLALPILLLTMKIYKTDIRYFTLIISFSTLIAIGLSELLAVYDWNGVFHVMNKSLDTQTLNQLSSNRIQIWSDAFELVKENWLFGLGSQGYYFTENRLPSIVQPHNILIQFLVEWGVVGTLLFFILLAKALWSGIQMHLVKKDVDNEYHLAAGTVICILMIHSLAGGVFFHPQPSMYLSIAFAIWILPSGKNNILSSGIK